MSGVEVVAVVACVAAVISAYHDGSQVFSEIRRKWRERRNSHPQASSAVATDLEYSLQRSREDILTQWNGHVSRLGHRFEMGDDIAQATMKDILIGLQIALLTHLRENGVHLDIFALLNVSDLSRARTISALHELYQRMAQAAPIPWHMTSPVPPGLPVVEPGSGLARYILDIERLSSASSHSYRYGSGSAGYMEQQWRGGNISTARPSPPGRVFSGSISNSPPDMYRAPIEGPSPGQGQGPRERRSSAFSSFSSTFNTWLRERRRSSVESSGGIERDDRSDIAAIAGLPSPPPTAHNEATATATAPRPIPRPTRAELEAPAENDELNLNPWISVMDERTREELEIEEEVDRQVKTPPPICADTSVSTLAPRHPSLNLSGPPPSTHSDISNESSSSSRSNDIRLIPHNPGISLWPPSRDNDYAGFCKGAWKLNSGFEGFKVHNVPIGYYSLVPKWKCTNCFFDMPISPPSTSSSHKPTFDEKVYTHPPLASATAGVSWQRATSELGHGLRREIVGSGRLGACSAVLRVIG
ncbi:hypothetical protein N7532_001011 [Penicillium argentinense]|uniref:Uncharacterized protein n=1 Tax=Penicillium argentinense TaxID=1131581 RepID=A0A9W9KM08_9EURO|nr:uncharacterized protein N7532_001011 [Penicillium argentinense]KAJ5110476.1 hypothetical protein N7532_001011 [Penicillium argentinense]